MISAFLCVPAQRERRSNGSTSPPALLLFLTFTHKQRDGASASGREVAAKGGRKQARWRNGF